MAALYIVGVWLLLQVADVVFPGFDIPNSAIQVLLYAAIAGLPVALVFGWIFDVGRHGIRRTGRIDAGEVSAARPLTRGDYFTLLVFALVAGGIVFEAASRVRQVPRESGRADATSDDARPVATLERSIAVLPFANISEDRANEIFSDGISEEILNRLADFRQLNVIGRTSSFAFKGKDDSIPRIARLLGVRYLLQGSVRKYGDQLRISAQLLDASGVQVWAQEFDRRLVNVFEVQTEIANAVATTVAPKVAPQAAYTRTPDLDAYQHYLAGREYLHERNVPTAISELEQATAIDPDYAEAHAELAIARAMIARGDAALIPARTAVERALSLQPTMPRALAAQAFLWLQQRVPEYARAEAQLRRVLEVDPSMSDALLWLSIAVREQGRDDEGFAIQERALRIDPLHPSLLGNVANTLSLRGEEARAEKMIMRALQSAPGGHGLYLWLRVAYQRTGRLVELNHLVKQQAINRGGPNYFGLALSYALFGDWRAAEYWIRRSQVDFPFRTFSLCIACLPVQWRGDFQLAKQMFADALRTSPQNRSDEDVQKWFGTLQVLGGDDAAGIATLEPVVDAARDLDRDSSAPDAVQVLALAYQRVGQRQRAAALLDAFENRFKELDAEGVLQRSQRLPYGDDLYLYAVNAVLRGDHALALNRLERAINSGWRDYYIREHDPAWDPLRKDARFQRLMAKVKADVDRQHREVQAGDAREDFVTRLDAALAAEREHSANTRD